MVWLRQLRPRFVDRVCRVRSHRRTPRNDEDRDVGAPSTVQLTKQAMLAPLPGRLLEPHLAGIATTKKETAQTTCFRIELYKSDNWEYMR